MVMSDAINRSQGEAIILEILKGYQAFTQVSIDSYWSDDVPITFENYTA